jgi:hypothetical protein
MVLTQASMKIAPPIEPILLINETLSLITRRFIDTAMYTAPPCPLSGMELLKNTGRQGEASYCRAMQADIILVIDFGDYLCFQIKSNLLAK